MPKITFRFNGQREISNWYGTIRGTSKFGLSGGRTKYNLGDIPSDMAQIIADTDEETSKLLIRKRLEEEYEKPERKKLIEKTIDRAQKRWETVSKEYFRLLSELINVPEEKFEKEYFAEYTFGARCPFFRNSFMFSRFMDFADNAMHEIMHIEFFKEYRNYCKEKGLNDNQIDHLKEILTVLLNESMKNLLSKPEIGYTKHKELRAKALEIHKDSKNFREFLDKMIELIKKVNF